MSSLELPAWARGEGELPEWASGMTPEIALQAYLEMMNPSAVGKKKYLSSSTVSDGEHNTATGPRLGRGTHPYDVIYTSGE